MHLHSLHCEMMNELQQRNVLLFLACLFASADVKWRKNLLEFSYKMTMLIKSEMRSVPNEVENNLS